MNGTNKKTLFRGPPCAFRLPIADWRPLRYCACATKHGYISFHLTPHVNKAAGSSAELLTAKAESEKSCQEGFFRSVGHWARKAGPGKRNTSEGATDYLLTDLRVDHCGTMLRGIAPGRGGVPSTWRKPLDSGRGRHNDSPSECGHFGQPAVVIPQRERLVNI